MLVAQAVPRRHPMTEAVVGVAQPWLHRRKSSLKQLQAVCELVPLLTLTYSLTITLCLVAQ